MREAIGGGWILGFIVMFIVIFTSYLAVSINYTKAFKVKNRIVSIIEENEGFSVSNYTNGNPNISVIRNQNTTEDKIYTYLYDLGYYNNIGEGNCTSGNMDGELFARGYCIQKICAGEGGAYYKVRTFINFVVPIFNINISIPINGETKVIYNDRGKYQGKYGNITCR